MTSDKYLARHAEPEAVLASKVGGHYAAVLVVPALDESVSLLDGFQPALRSSSGRVLLVLVVNARADCRTSAHEQNARLLEDVVRRARGRESLGSGCLLLDHADADVLLVDRASPGRELPARQGVGLARKIGADVALKLLLQGRVALPWIFTTDADATLPADYFARAAAASKRNRAPSALLYPFEHTASEDAVVTRATWLYELSLRYRVLGLAWAGSPYAQHSLGSTVAIDPQAYAAVHGFPKRQAGEDFYLLDKLAKLSPVERLAGEAITLRARSSDRAPFGTGPRVRQIADADDVLVPAPQAFAALRQLLDGLNAVARTRELAALERDLPPLSSEARAAWHHALATSGIVAACEQAVRRVGEGSLQWRLHTWFDSLRTLRFLHALRDAGLADLSWARALAEAPFFAESFATLEQSLSRARTLELGLPAPSGPALFAPNRLRREGT